MTTAVASTRLTQFQDIAAFLKSQNVERDEDIDLLMLSVISGVDALFLGDPGVGKTWMIELLVNDCLTDMSLFSHLLAKDQSATEILGPPNPMAMKAGKVERFTDGFLPTSNVAYLDEVFKSSPPQLNPLLDLMANRVLKVGGSVMDCKQLIAIIMSSNELPDREDLLAFRDRIGMTKYVQPVKSPEGRRAVTDIQLGFQTGGIDTSAVVPLTLADIETIRDEVRQVTVNDACRQIMVDAQQKWLEAGHPPSQRRIGQMWKVVKAHAWSNGRHDVVADDFLPCQHMAWNHPDDAESARSVILEFASVFTRKAQRAREAMEPIAQAMESLRTKLDAATEDEKDDLMNDGFKFIRQLRKLGREVKVQVKEGEQQGQDTSLLKELSDDINRLDKWAENALTGADEDE